MGENVFVLFWAAVAAGALTYLLTPLGLHLTETLLTKLWLRTYASGGKHRGFVARVRITIYLCRFTRFLPFLHSMVATALVLWWIPDPEFNWWIGVFFFAGFWVIPVLLSPRYVTRRLPYFSLILSITAAKRLVAFAPKKTQQKVLRAASRRSDTRTMIAAINGYMETSDAWALAELERMAQYPDIEAKKAAKEALGFLHIAVYGSGPMSLAPMTRFIQDYASVEESLKYDQFRLSAKKRLLAGFGEKIDNIVYSQLKLREGFPDLYCKTCLSRAEQQQFREWEWVRCKRCHDVQGLVTGVERVIGEIGGEEAWKLTDRVLQVQLWDAGQRQARRADIDTLLVIGGKEMDYNWAVGAVVQKLDHQMGEDDPAIVVRLVNSPPLDANSMLLLKSLKAVVEE